MIPVMYDGSKWVKADVTNKNATYRWYSYTEADKQWANAVTVTNETNRATYLSASPGVEIPMTEINAMWVWIPRYAYQIESGYHISTARTINVKFLRNTSNKDKDNVEVATIPTYSGSSQTNFIKHPAFTFGDKELTGIWVAKFEASGTSSAIDIKPGVASLRMLTIGEMFTASRNMEINSKYGWDLASGLDTYGIFGTDTNNLDTHLMKNIEWGAVTYLAQSTYGKNAEIWLNPSSSYITGCAGSVAAASSSSGCSYHYHTSNGQQASTTGTIYGIYDMLGGAFEYTSAYVNNNNTNLTTYGNSIITANGKYKDVYTVGDPDDSWYNYSLTIDKKGDALYETSTYSYEWYGYDWQMPYSGMPWFPRGFSHEGTDNPRYLVGTGYVGAAYGTDGFRPVLIVYPGL